MDELSTEEQVFLGPEGNYAVVLLVPGRMDGPDVELRVIRPGDALAIGRARAGDEVDSWRIEDATVSRRHARIVREGGAFYLEDAGSRNGTWLSGAILRGERIRLTSGSLIVLGEVGVVRRLSADEISAVEIDQARPLGPVATASGALATVLRRMRILAPTDRPVLLAGETGTGKEVYARAIHGLSGRKGAFVAVNCASLHGDLLESHLFGYKRGSHSQAVEDSPGILSTAEHGTLFLDEIGEMDPTLQTKLLRFLQDRTFFGLGATRARQADVRIIAATQSPRLSLREDILGRLGAEALALPPLRKRREDLPALCRHFLRRLPAESEVQGIERAVSYAICRYGWPRNVRELEATIAEAALSAAERGVPRISLADLPRRISGPLLRTALKNPGRVQEDSEKEPGPRQRRRSRPTREALKALLRDHGGEVPAVARYLHRTRELVWRWCRLDGIDPGEFKNGKSHGATAVGLTRNGRLTGGKGSRDRRA